MKINALVLFVFCILFSPRVHAQQYTIDQVIAIIGNKMVKQSDVEDEFLQMKAQGYPVDENSKCSIFERILEHKLLVNQAMIDSLEISDSQIESELTQRIGY